MILELATNDDLFNMLLSARYISGTYRDGLGLNGQRVKFGGRWYGERDIELEIDRRVKYGKVIKW